MKLFTSLALTAAVAMAAPAYADTVVANGTTVGEPTYNRVLPGTPPSGLSAVGTNVNYSVVDFTVDLSGTYTLSLETGFDSFLTLYSGSFDPTSPLTNALSADDDSLGSFGDAQIISSLLAGTSYFAVVSAFGNGDAGDYALTITGPGGITIGGAGVPEPATWGLMILGFGAIGGAMRRRQSVKATVRFA